MAKSKKAGAAEAALTEEERQSLDGFNLDGGEPAANLLAACVAAQEDGGGEPAEPLMTDPEWNDFAMSQFAPGEVDAEGHPFVHGLRRVARLLLGPVIESRAHVVQAPHLAGEGQLTPATVEHTVKFLWFKCKDHGIETPYEVTFTEAADVWEHNTDPGFRRYATAVASTRAEARCYTKALGLKKCSHDELTKVPVPVPQFEAATGDGLISEANIGFIDMNCRRANIDVMAFINMGKEKYDSITAVPDGMAARMCKRISGYITNPGTVHESLRGKPYNPNWKENK